MKIRKNPIEWTVFGIGSVLVLGVMGILILEWVGADQRPADIEVTVGDPVPSNGGYRMLVRARNIGSATAEQVRIEVLLRRGAQSVEQAEITLAFLPRRAERKGWVFFRNDPRRFQVLARPVGYQEP